MPVDCFNKKLVPEQWCLTAEFIKHMKFLKFYRDLIDWPNFKAWTKVKVKKISTKDSKVPKK